MQAPNRKSYDVVIIGGAMYGSSVAWWLTKLGFDGTILVVERDPSYEFSSTGHTNSCMRQQFSNPVNVQISQFAADFVKNFRAYIGDEKAPDLPMHCFGYMYLAGTQSAVQTLAEAQKVQAALGAGTQHMSAEEIKKAYPFYNTEDIIAGNHNLIDEGYFDGGTIFDWWRRKARDGGAEYVHNEVVDMSRSDGRVTQVTLSTGESIACGTVVNCSGPRAAVTARMLGIDLPVEPRKRYTFIFSSEDTIGQDVPLTIDPSGVHFRTDGGNFMAGCPPDDDVAVGYDDFAQDHSIWEEKVWPVLAHRVPAFERIKLLNSWAGHYAFNTFDQNAIVGPHRDLPNFIFVNGFSGHGLQQSPAFGRGVAELIVFGEYRSLNLSEFGHDRLIDNISFRETAVI